MHKSALSFVLLMLLTFFANVCEAAPPALTGIVSSDAEGPMEGVVVKAKFVGGTITVSVVTNREGRYEFSSGRLPPGAYQLTIRAIGYLSANRNQVVTVGSGSGQADIKLVKTPDLAAQLSDVEWLMSMPGTDAQKQKLFVGCDLCHSLAPILNSTYDAAGWITTLTRMHNWIPGSLLAKPILSPFRAGAQPGDEEFAKYLSSINLSARAKHDFAFKTLPRPKGEDTKVIITEYDLPRQGAEPHDAVADAHGMVWYSDYAEPIVGRLNPRTGAVKEFRDPLDKPGFNGGFLDLELDGDGNVWVGRPGPGFNGFAKLDTKTGQFTNFTNPIETVEQKSGDANLGFIVPMSSTGFVAVAPDGKVWNRDNFTNRAFRLDPATGKISSFAEFPSEIMSRDYHGPRHRIYSIRASAQGDLYEADIEGSIIFRVDATGGNVSAYPTPTPDSGPRRMHWDTQGRLWIGECYSKQIAMLDPQTGKIQEFPQPIPWYGPYDVVPDKNGEVWTGSTSSDLITRFNPKTGEFRHYLLPTLDTNFRRADLDTSGPRPVFWVGENHQGKIAKVEPLD
jgi:virginiamycin B lyase